MPAAALAVAYQARLSVTADRERPLNAREVGRAYVSEAHEDEFGSEGTAGTGMPAAAKDESENDVVDQERTLPPDNVAAELRLAVARLAGRLREATDAVLAGRGTEGRQLLDDLDAWAELRTRMESRLLLGAAPGRWTPATRPPPSPVRPACSSGRRRTSRNC